MYKLKKGVELPEKFKIKVNPKQSEALQEHIFSLGGTWFNNSQTVSYTDADYLFYGTNRRNTLTRHYSDRSWFENSPVLKIKFKDYFTDVPEKQAAQKDADDTLTRIALKFHILLHENKTLQAEVKSLRSSDREYYKNRCSVLRKKLWELTDKRVCHRPSKWCVKITKENISILNKYMRDNPKRYKGINDTWIVSGSIIGLYFLSNSREMDFACNWHPVDYELITTKQLKKRLCEEQI